MGNNISQTLLEFKDRCFRFLWRRRTGLLSLPPDLLHLILKNVGENSFGNLCRSKAICKTLRDVVDSETFMTNLDLRPMHTPYKHLSGVRLFFERCLEKGNPSALFIRGAWDFFKKGRRDEGLLRIRLAAEKHYPLAMYVYANISLIMNIGDEMRFVRSRDFMRKFRNIVDRFPNAASPPLPLPEYWINKVQEIPVGQLYNCDCCPTTGWEYEWNEAVKTGAMCYSCFKTIQAIWFAKEFTSKVIYWPEKNELEDQRDEFSTEFLNLQDVNRSSHCIKMLVVSLLVLFVSVLLKFV